MRIIWSVAAIAAVAGGPGGRTARWIAGAAILASASLLLPAAASAGSGGHGRLPKGTPYAAEVIATITGESHIAVVATTTTLSVCESESAVAEENEDFDFRWKARYPQVTVPVAGENELGRAFHKLHVRAQPTSDGRGGLTSGEYRFTGKAPLTAYGGQPAGGSDCAKQPYEEGGTFAATHPTFGEISLGEGGAGPGSLGSRDLFEFDLGTIIAATPAVRSPDPRANLDATLEYLPTAEAIFQAPPNYDSVPAEFRVATLKRLLRKPSITVYRRTNGTSDCASESNDLNQFKCTVKWNYQFRIKLTRRFLYRTKAEYAK